MVFVQRDVYDYKVRTEACFGRYSVRKSNCEVQPVISESQEKALISTCPVTQGIHRKCISEPGINRISQMHIISQPYGRAENLMI